MKKLAILLFTLTLFGCGPFKPYEADVQQGNQLDLKTVQQIHTGMSKDAVVAIIGSPVLGDTFDDNHWSYVYTNQINGGKIEKRNLELDFRNDRLIKISSKM